MELYSNIWTILESSAFLFIVIIFFKDPIRRWNFFGYRPSAVLGTFDPHMGKVLFSKTNHAWSFNQGAMYENNIYGTVNSILRRELGLPETRCKLVYTRPLGVIRITNKQLLNRARISTISIFKNLRGKGYMACFIRANLENIEAEIQRGAGVQETRVVGFDEARQLVKDCVTNEHQPKKQEMILGMIDEIEKLANEMKKWEVEFGSQVIPPPESTETEKKESKTEKKAD